jgi:hypothetical protein
MAVVNLKSKCPYCNGKVILALDNALNGHFICENNHMWMFKNGSVYRQVYDMKCPQCNSDEKIFLLRIPFYSGREAYHEFSIPCINNFYECHSCNMEEAENPDQFYMFGFYQERYPDRKVFNENYLNKNGE